MIMSDIIIIIIITVVVIITKMVTYVGAWNSHSSPQFLYFAAL